MIKMKNIHVLPTDKPSRLWFNDLTDDGKLILSLEDIETSNSGIQIGDEGWLWSTEYGLCKFNLVETLEDLEESFSITDRKIILATDPDLIADGVQNIDDTFLEWFVNNPSCENVKYIFKYNSPYVYNSEGHIPDETSPKTIHIGYELKIPQEEPKQQLLKQYPLTPNECFKQETLEEAAEKYAEGKSSNFSFRNTHIRDFIAGANFQAERMYSKEEVLKILLASNVELGIIDKTSEVEEWFNKFKKK